MCKKSHRILIVDDDPDICANLSDILAEIGYQTATAESGEVALQMVEQESLGEECSFDLCLLDFKMPGIDGVELYTRIQDLDPRLRAILITAYTGDDGMQRAAAAGTWRVLRKPVDIKELLGMINEAVSDPESSTDLELS